MYVKEGKHRMAAIQEYLASYGVSVDEAGVDRLRRLLEENRTLAACTASAFDTARRAADALNGIAPAVDIQPALDSVAALNDTVEALRPALHVDTSAMLAAVRQAVSKIRQLFDGLKLKIPAVPDAPSAPGGGTSGAAANAFSVSAAAYGAASGPQITRQVQAPVTVNVTSSAASPEAVGRSVYSAAERALLRTLKEALS